MPASSLAARIARAITSAGAAVDWKPWARPAMMFVACPVSDAAAMLFTGRKRVAV